MAEKAYHPHGYYSSNFEKLSSNLEDSQQMSQFCKRRIINTFSEGGHLLILEPQGGFLFRMDIY